MSAAAAVSAKADARIDRRQSSARSGVEQTPPAGDIRIEGNGDDLEQLVCDLRLSVSAISRIVLQPGEAVALAPCDDHAMYCVLAGEGESTAGDHSTAMRSGSAILMTRSGSTAFQAASTGGALMIVCLVINAQLAQRPQFLDWLAEPLYDHDDATLKIEALSVILDVAEQPRVGGMAIAEALLKAVFVGMLLRVADRRTLDRSFMASITQPGVARVVNYVADHPGRQHTAEGMAALAGVTQSELSSRFHGIFGLSPAEYVRQVRLRYAGMLLKDTDLPVKTIAGMVGFNSRSHFSRIFYDHSGLDPTAFRRSGAKGCAYVDAVATAGCDG